MNKTNIQTQILEALSTEQVIDDTLTLFPSAMQLEVLGVLNGLLSRNMILYKTINIERWSLTTEGKDIAQSGSHEARVFNGIPVGEGISFEGLTAKIGISTKFGQGPAFRMKWVEKKKNGELSRLCETIIDQTQLDLLKIASTESHSDDAVLKAMKKRNLIQVVKSFSYRVEKGADFSMEVKREETDITAELLVGEGWKNSTFKKYNFDAEGLPPKRGHLHPLLKVRDEFRQIFFELGYFYYLTAAFQRCQQTNTSSRLSGILMRYSSHSSIQQEMLKILSFWQSQPLAINFRKSTSKG